MRRLLLLLGLALAVSAAPAEARSGSCLVPGFDLKCTIWTGKVTFVGDGDTIYVDVDGDGSHRSVSVRFIGINAMEQTVYSADPSQRRGYCHALEATRRLEGLIRRARGRVRLASLDASSSSRHRWRRAVAVRIGGRWRDVGRLLVAEGHALWLAAGNEWAWNASYNLLAERAAAAHRGIWSATSCGRGPQDDVPLRVTVNGDADGSEEGNVNGEWVRVRNLHPTKTIHLGGWSLGNSTPERYVFPEWATIPPGEEIELHVGRGTDTWTQLFWGRRKAIFENAGDGRRGVGDGAFLFDPQGDLRAWSTYPCRLSCADPLRGRIVVSARTTGPESVTVRNVGSADADLDGYRIWSSPHVYPFPYATVLAPGEQLVVQVVGDPDEDTRLLKYWGKPGAIFDDRGDTVRLTNLRGVEVDCAAYGTATC